MACQAVEEAAVGVCQKLPLTRIDTAQRRANATLGRLRDDAGREVRINSASVHLTVPPDIAQQAADHQHALRAQELANELQRHELSRLDRFRRTVLADPGAAMAYRFMKYPEKLDKETYTQIENLVKTMMDYDPNKRWLQVATLLDKFIKDLNTSDKQALLAILQSVLASHGHRNDAYTIAAILDPAGQYQAQTPD